MNPGNFQTIKLSEKATKAWGVQAPGFRGFYFAPWQGLRTGNGVRRASNAGALTAASCSRAIGR